MDNLGQIGLVRTSGFTSWLTRIVTRSAWNHVICRVTEHDVVSAQPDGVRKMLVTDFPNVVWSEFDLTPKQTAKIIAFSLLQVGKPYGTLTYIWIGTALLLRIHTPAWLEARLSDEHTWICSQLVDSAYRHAGIHLFDDDRTQGAVVPATFGKLFKDCGWTNRA